MPEDSRAAERLRYIPQFDGLRAVAISLVVLHHLFATWDWTSAPVSITAIANYGIVGVDIFFVLSGFLITTILLRSGGGFPALRHFYIKRILRIWPIYYLLWAVTCLQAAWTHVPYPWARSLVFLQNFLPVWPAQQDFDQTWSLCVEEHFYLLWPLLVLFLPRRVMPAIAGAVLVASPLVRFFGLHAGATAKQLYTYSQYRMDGIALGSLLALLLASDRLKGKSLERAGWSLLIACLPAAVWVTAWFEELSLSRAILADTLYALAFTGLLSVTLASRVVAGVLSLAPLRYLGRISYGLYMIHPFVFALAGQHIPGVKGMIVGVGLSLGLAALSWKLLESPLLRMARNKSDVKRPGNGGVQNMWAQERNTPCQKPAQM